MTTLYRALTFPEVNKIAKAITKYLNFNMTRLFYKLFNKYPIVPKRIPGLVLTCSKALKGFFLGISNTQSFTTTTSRCFNHDWITNVFGNFNRFIGAANGCIMSWDSVDFGFFSEFFGGDLISHRCD